MDGGFWHCTRDSDQDHPQEKEIQKRQNGWGGLQIAGKRKAQKAKEKRKDIPNWIHSSKE